MTSNLDYQEAFVWIWLPDAVEPVVAGKLTRDGQKLLFNYGRSYLERPDAIAIYDRVLAVQPRNAKAMLRLCEVYRKVGEFERALGYCQDAVQADPAYTQAYLQLGSLLYNRLDFAGALSAYDQCFANDPNNLECQFRRGLDRGKPFRLRRRRSPSGRIRRPPNALNITEASPRPPPRH